MAYYKGGMVTLDIEKGSRFLCLPDHIQIYILSFVDPKDIHSFGQTCRQAHQLVQDKYLWSENLWNHSKVINVALPTMRRYLSDRDLSLLLHDKTLIDTMKLAMFLNRKPLMSAETARLKKTRKITNKIQSFFKCDSNTPNEQQTTSSSSDPSILFASAWETPLSKKLFFDVVTPEGTELVPIGLVQGRNSWNGIGGGITVDWRGKYLNLLPIRKGKLRAATEVWESLQIDQRLSLVLSSFDGLIYYFDGRCVCSSLQKARPNENSEESRLREFFRTNSDALNRKTEYAKPTKHIVDHIHTGDISELEMLIKNCDKDQVPPILIFILGEASIGHQPKDFFPFLEHLQTPWMILPVDGNTNEQLNLGLRWLLKSRN